VLHGFTGEDGNWICLGRFVTDESFPEIMIIVACEE
jgi:hypothetical protein